MNATVIRIPTTSTRPVVLGDLQEHRSVHLSEPRGQWRDDVVRRLGELVRLERGWDGYRARAVDFATAHFALSMLDRICLPLTPTPEIVPGVSGDLQIEWHLGSVDIELHVKKPYNVHAWRGLEGGDPEGEHIATRSDFAAVSRWIAELPESRGAFETAAA